MLKICTRTALLLGALVGITPFASAADANSSEQTGLTDMASPAVWRVEFSPYTVHYSSNPEHRPVYLIGLERETPDRYFYGGAYFSNSFGQDSGYAYFGRSYYNVLKDWPRVYFKWSLGLMYGYKEPYENKVPLNYKGFSPGFVPAVGWQFDGGWNGQVNILGTAGLMFSVVKGF